MIFHLFEKYPDKKYIIIGDYQYDVLDRYLHTFAKVNFDMVDARGQKGTCGGLQDALEKVPEGQPFMLIWCDLVLPEEFVLPESSGNYVGISKDFPCRWSWNNDSFYEGVALTPLLQRRSQTS